MKPSGKTQKNGKQPSGVNSTFTARDPGAVPPGNLKSANKVTIKLKGAKVDFKGTKLCTLSRTNATNCGDSTKGGQPKSNVGSGSAKVNIFTNSNPPAAVFTGVSATVTAYLHLGRIYLILNAPTLQQTLVIDASLSKSGKLVANLQRDVANSPAVQMTGLKPVLTDFK